MKIFFFMGRNADNKSGLSWKIWKINRRGRVVTVFWGAAKLVQRKPKLVNVPQEKIHRLRSVEAARDFEQSIIRSKEAKGYQRSTHWREK
jgi:hypothetical protein